VHSGARMAGKVALVTGGASGMGAAHVRALAREGARVAITDIAAEAGAELEGELRAAGSEVAFYEHDVTDSDSWEQVVTGIERAYGRIDVLVNNAGIQMRSVGIEVEDREWDTVTAVNQRGVFMGLRAVIPGMVSAGGGSIVNIASLAALVGLPGSLPYQASKSAVLGLTRGAAVAYGPDNIRVNAICPGLIVTGMTESATDEAIAGILSQVALRRDGRPEEVAGVVLFLASDESSYITGVALPVDGGYTAA
jgi:3alpha(or 20beta)-hydroxysteroid dehydrogenase